MIALELLWLKVYAFLHLASLLICYFHHCALYDALIFAIYPLQNYRIGCSGHLKYT